MNKKIQDFIFKMWIAMLILLLFFISMDIHADTTRMADVIWTICTSDIVPNGDILDCFDHYNNCLFNPDMAVDDETIDKCISEYHNE